MKRKLITLLLAVTFSMSTTCVYAEEMTEAADTETVEVEEDTADGELEKGYKYVTFKTSTDEPRNNQDTVILLYKGDVTDVYVELSPDNDYTDRQALPQGNYVLDDVISMTGKTYNFEIGDNFTVFTDDVDVDIADSTQATAQELLNARAQDQTERNRAREQAIEEGKQHDINKVGGKVSATDDVQAKSNNTVIAVIVIIALIIAAAVTVSCAIRAQKKKLSSGELLKDDE